MRSKPEERKKQLINIGTELFSAKGYEQTMITDITERAGVAKATFFYYFSSKEALLEAIIGQYEERIKAAAAASQGKTALRRLEAFLGELNVFRELDPMVTRLEADDRQMWLLEAWRNMQQRLNPVLEEILQQGVTENSMQLASIPESIYCFWFLVTAMLLANHRKEDEAVLQKKAVIGSSLLEKLLGLPEHSLHAPSK